MDKKITLWIVICALLIVALFITYQAGAVSVATVEPVKVASQSAASSYVGMVGGC